MAEPRTPSPLFLLSATEEELQVAEDWLREAGRLDEANRLRGFRVLEPLMRQFAEADAVTNREYARAGSSFDAPDAAAAHKRRWELETAIRDLILALYPDPDHDVSGALRRYGTPEMLAAVARGEMSNVPF